MLTKNEGFKKYYIPVISTSYLVLGDFCVSTFFSQRWCISKYFILMYYLLEVPIVHYDRNQKI